MVDPGAPDLDVRDPGAPDLDVRDPGAPDLDRTAGAVERLLRGTRTWAVVGCSPRPGRASHEVAAFLLGSGYRVIPVHPDAVRILGQTCYPNLEAIPEAVDVVDIFRRSEEAGTHVDEAVRIGARGVWLQLGVIDHRAARRAREAGLDVVMDRCPKIELPRLYPPRSRTE